MFYPITIQELLQLLLNIRVGYPDFARDVDVDGFIEVLAYTEGNVIPPYMWERALWLMTRFAQYLYKFPTQLEMDISPIEFVENNDCDC